MTARADHILAQTGPALVIVRVFDAPRSLVFAAWTEPDRARHWWSPDGFDILACEMDVRPGGAWRRCMRSPVGDIVWKRGVYREIDPPTRLVFTYSDEIGATELGTDATGPETLVTLTFEDAGSHRTRFTLHHEGFRSDALRESHEGGWTTCFARFARYLAMS